MDNTIDYSELYQDVQRDDWEQSQREERESWRDEYTEAEQKELEAEYRARLEADEEKMRDLANDMKI